MRGPVPAAVLVGEGLVTVERAWPSGEVEDDGARVVRLEGRDTRGRVRAGTVSVLVEDSWSVVRAEIAPPGRDHGLPGLPDAAAEGQVVVHRLGRRAVVRTGDRFVKVVRPHTVEAVATATRTGRVLARAAGFDAPTVLDPTRIDGEAGSGPGSGKESRGGGRVDQSVLPGTSAHEAGGSAAPGDWDRWWHDWSVRWPDLTGADTTDVPGLTVHGPEQEVVTLRRWVDQVVALRVLDGLGERLREESEAAVEALREDPGPRSRVSHRDLHDKQIFFGGPRPGLLDFDTVALAEPALDLANLAVHVRLRSAQGLWSPWHRDRALSAVAEVVTRLDVPDHRLAAYSEATRLRLVCVYAMRPRWHRLAVSLLLREPVAVPR